MATICTDLRLDGRESRLAFVADPRCALQKQCRLRMTFACRSLEHVDGRTRPDASTHRFLVYVHCLSVTIALSVCGFPFPMNSSWLLRRMAWTFSASVMLTASADKRGSKGCVTAMAVVANPHANLFLYAQDSAISS